MHWLRRVRKLIPKLSAKYLREVKMGSSESGGEQGISTHPATFSLNSLPAENAGTRFSWNGHRFSRFGISPRPLFPLPWLESAKAHLS